MQWCTNTLNYFWTKIAPALSTDTSHVSTLYKKHTFAYLVHLAKYDKMNYAEINFGNTSLMWVLSPLFR